MESIYNELFSELDAQQDAQNEIAFYLCAKDDAETETDIGTDYDTQTNAIKSVRVVEGKHEQHKGEYAFKGWISQSEKILLAKVRKGKR